MVDKTPFELDAQIAEHGGEVLPGYQGANAPVFQETADHEPTADDLIEMYGDLADTALAGVKAGIPDEMKVFIAEGRAKKAQDPTEQFLVRQRARYTDPNRWN